MGADGKLLGVPAMLGLLEDAYRTLVEREAPATDDQVRLVAVLGDLRWYAERLGAERWEQPPRLGRWSFAQNLWHITDQAAEAAKATVPLPLRYFIDHGKEHVGQAAEIFALFEYSN